MWIHWPLTSVISCHENSIKSKLHYVGNQWRVKWVFRVKLNVVKKINLFFDFSKDGRNYISHTLFYRIVRCCLWSCSFFERKHCFPPILYRLLVSHTGRLNFINDLVFCCCRFSSPLSSAFKRNFKNGRRKRKWNLWAVYVCNDTSSNCRWKSTLFLLIFRREVVWSFSVWCSCIGTCDLWYIGYAMKLQFVFSFFHSSFLHVKNAMGKHRQEEITPIWLIVKSMKVEQLMLMTTMDQFSKALDTMLTKKSCQRYSKPCLCLLYS